MDAVVDSNACSNTNANTRSLQGLEDYDPEMYNITLADERTYIETFYTSQAGAAIAATTGTISTISSLLIIYLIYKKSKTGFKTVYHRIMLGMSCSDVLASASIALATLPMPKDMIYPQFEGLVLGNTNTCSAQGFFFIFGALCTTGYLMSLMLYYLLSIHYKKTDNEIATRIEPLLHASTIIYGSAVSFSLLAFESFNPSPLESWCTAITLPWWCPGQLDEACLIRTKREAYTVRHIMGVHFIFVLLVSVGSLMLIVWGVYSQERLFKVYTENTRHSAQSATTLNRDFQYTRKILKQASGYALAYLTVNAFPVISLVMGKVNLGNGAYPICHLILRPLQGFLNLIIFIYHKVDSIQRAAPGTTRWEATRQVFASTTQEQPEFIISSLSLVRIDDNNKQDLGEEGGLLEEIMIVDNGASPPSMNIGGDSCKESAADPKKFQFYAEVLERFGNTDNKKLSPAAEISSKVDKQDLSGFSLGSGMKKDDASENNKKEIDSFDDNDISYLSPGGTMNSAGISRFSCSISGVLSSFGGGTKTDNSDISFTSPGDNRSFAVSSRLSLDSGDVSFIMSRSKESHH